MCLVRLVAHWADFYPDNSDNFNSWVNASGSAMPHRDRQVCQTLTSLRATVLYSLTSSLVVKNSLLVVWGVLDSCKCGKITLTHLVVVPLYIWDIHVMSWWANIFVFFPVEDINTNQVDLQGKRTSVTVHPLKPNATEVSTTGPIWGFLSFKSYTWDEILLTSFACCVRAAQAKRRPLTYPFTFQITHYKKWVKATVLIFHRFPTQGKAQYGWLLVCDCSQDIYFTFQLLCETEQCRWQQEG